MTKINRNIVKIFFLSFVYLVALNGKVLSQNNSPIVSIRLSLQSDFQKADFKDSQFPYQFKKHSATALNWGIDLLKEKNISNRWSVYVGAGYFRNKLNFKRAYDHQLLNAGRDSLPIGTSTSDYSFHLFRLPIGVSYGLVKKNKYNFSLGLENAVNFSFQQVYNGEKPFPDANNKYSIFKYYGNTVLFFLRFSNYINQNSLLQIEPYVRLLNIFKRKDLFLFESNSNPYVRTFDGIGLSLKYSIIFKHKKHKS